MTIMGAMPNGETWPSRDCPVLAAKPGKRPFKSLVADVSYQSEASIRLIGSERSLLVNSRQSASRFAERWLPLQSTVAPLPPWLFVDQRGDRDNVQHTGRQYRRLDLR